jgi:hypothetical protein
MLIESAFRRPSVVKNEGNGRGFAKGKMELPKRISSSLISQSSIFNPLFSRFFGTPLRSFSLKENNDEREKS